MPDFDKIECYSARRCKTLSRLTLYLNSFPIIDETVRVYPEPNYFDTIGGVNFLRLKGRDIQPNFYKIIRYPLIPI